MAFKIIPHWRIALPEPIVSGSLGKLAFRLMAVIIC